MYYPLEADELQYLRARLQSRKMTLELLESAINWLGDIGFDPVYGARPLKRAISHHVENSIAKMILLGKYQQGSVIKVDVKDDELTFA